MRKSGKDRKCPSRQPVSARDAHRWWTWAVPNFRERRLGEVRLGPGPMGGDFSGSSTVTSRNPLLHDGATNATWSPRFDGGGVAACRRRVLIGTLAGSLATANFREYLFHA